MRVTINDEAVEVDDRTSVADLLARLGLPDKGVAVAIKDPDWAVVPRSQWHVTLFRRGQGRGRDGGAGWLTATS